MKTLYSPESQKISEWLRKQRELKGLTMRQAGELLESHIHLLGRQRMVSAV